MKYWDTAAVKCVRDALQMVETEWVKLRLQAYSEKWDFLGGVVLAGGAG